MVNSESKEMYLETILQLHQRGARVKSVDVAAELGFSRPSVSIAVKNLQNEGYVLVGADGELSLTESGLARARSVYERHCVLTKFFVSLGAEKGSAEENACRIEHIISDDLFELIKRAMEQNAHKTE
ncbi:MAG: metal-dependent transcriptional regulator [Christensenellaceae bacterium]